MVLIELVRKKLGSGDGWKNFNDRDSDEPCSLLKGENGRKNCSRFLVKASMANILEEHTESTSCNTVQRPRTKMKKNTKE